MSFRLVDKAMGADGLKMGERMVLMALASFASDKDNRAFPTVKQIGAKIKVHRTAVMRALRVLEVGGYIEVIRQHREVSQYVLLPHRWVVSESAEECNGERPRGVAESDPRCNGERPKGVTESDTNRSYEPIIESVSKNTPPSPSGVGQASEVSLFGEDEPEAEEPPKQAKPKKTDFERLPQECRDAFDRWWEVYPRKVKKHEARAAWAKLRPDAALLETMLASVRAWVGSSQWTKDNGDFIPYPASWLNGSRWEDELPTNRGSPLRNGYGRVNHGDLL